MWIELKINEGILINLDHFKIINIKVKNDHLTLLEFRLEESRKYSQGLSEEFETEELAKQRYEEIKDLLNNNSIEKKLDTIIENQDYWGKNIEGNTRR